MADNGKPRGAFGGGLCGGPGAQVLYNLFYGAGPLGRVWGAGLWTVALGPSQDLHGAGHRSGNGRDGSILAIIGVKISFSPRTNRITIYYRSFDDVIMAIL